jgi:ATP-binding cassette subfamily B protein
MAVAGKAFDYKLFTRIYGFVKPYKSTFIISLSITIFLALISPLRPYLVQYAFDHYVIAKNMTGLINTCLFILAILLVETSLQYTVTFLTNKIGQLVISDLRQVLFKKIIHFNLSYHDKSAVGTLVTRNISDIQNIADVFSQGFLEIAGDILKVIFIIIVMFSADWQLSLISLSTIPLMLYATNVFKNAIKGAFTDVRNAVSKLNTYVQEHITGMLVVQIFNRENAEYQKFENINIEHRDANIRSVWYYSVFFPVVEILSATSLGLLIWWGANGVLEGKYSIGIIISFIMYINLLFRPIRMLADRFNSLQMGMVCSERVFALIDTDSQTNNTGKVTADKIQGNIEFKNVWFSYKAEPTDEDWILRDVSFKLIKGETLALVGSTGSGKSTIAALINRFYDIQRGDILIDGISIFEYKLDDLRQQCAIVLQDVFLFSDTIYNNITLFDNISKVKVEQAAQTIGADAFINKLDEKFEFNVKERGGLLSVGQRQLISFVRAYVQKPKILIMDEATSSIDIESEQLIHQATEKLSKMQTTIIIAHRLSTIKHADIILVIEKGKIVERGKHDELLQQEGLYKNLYLKQFKEKDKTISM